MMNLGFFASAQRLSWSVAATLPAPGVAGPFVGVNGGVLLVAGGANFPGARPWEGGVKVYNDEIYVVVKDGGWRQVGRLPEKIAYGASVSTELGVVCMGGETGSGYSKKVFLLGWDGVVSVRELPDLPYGVANACAAAVGSRVFLAGGEDAGAALSGFYMLDLDSVVLGWVRLPPLPVAMSHSVAVGLSGGIYVIGGRSKTDSGISDLHSCVYRYDGVWKRMADIGDGGKVVCLSAASAVAYGGNIIVVGGDRGDVFHQIELLNYSIARAGSVAEADELTSRKIRLLVDHPGFSRAVLEYDVGADRWRGSGDLPGDGPVTTTAVLWDGAIYVACGEIHPGVRTPLVWKGSFYSK